MTRPKPILKKGSRGCGTV